MTTVTDLHIVESAPVVTLEATEQRGADIERMVNEALGVICPECSDYGRIAWVQGKIVYCECRAGVDAQLTDLERQIAIIENNLMTMPKCECNAQTRSNIRRHLNILEAQHDEIERTKWQPVYGRTE